MPALPEVAPFDRQSIHEALAFKAYEIEELADVYFFRPLGALVAHSARALGYTPTQVTIGSGVLGVIGGVLLYFPPFAVLGFTILIVYSILDSADGQLARMLGRTSELGKLLDGVAGYATWIAVYVTVMAFDRARGVTQAPIAWMLAAGLSHIAHMQLYDHYRTSYESVAIKGTAPIAPVPAIQQWVRSVLRVYRGAQRLLLGKHADVEAGIAARAHGGIVRDVDRAQYRACFYWPVRGWNFLGDNTRLYAIGLLAWTRHLEWFLPLTAIVMNAAFVVLWCWQARADRRFLARS